MPRNVTRGEFTEEEKDEIVELYETMGLNTLALRFECGQNKIKKVLVERKQVVHNRYYRRGNAEDSDYNEARGRTVKWRRIVYRSYMEQGLYSTAALYK